MTENDDYLSLLTRGAQIIEHRAVELAEAGHVNLTRMRWHRGVEVADLDDYWLVLELGKCARSEHFETQVLIEVAMGRKMELLTARLTMLISDLVHPREDAAPIRRSIGPASAWVPDASAPAPGSGKSESKSAAIGYFATKEAGHG